MPGRWSTSALRWLPIGFVSSGSPLGWLSRGSVFSGWDTMRYMRWLPELSFLSAVVDDFVWSVVTAFESFALVSMLCFFFLFCGCTV